MSRSASAWICATMRMLPGVPVRPSGEVIRTRGVPLPVRGGHAGVPRRAAVCSDERDESEIQVTMVSGVDGEAPRGRRRSSCRRPPRAGRASGAAVCFRYAASDSA